MKVRIKKQIKGGSPIYKVTGGPGKNRKPVTTRSYKQARIIAGARNRLIKKYSQRKRKK